MLVPLGLSYGSLAYPPPDFLVLSVGGSPFPRDKIWGCCGKGKVGKSLFLGRSPCAQGNTSLAPIYVLLILRDGMILFLRNNVYFNRNNFQKNVGCSSEFWCWMNYCLDSPENFCQMECCGDSWWFWGLRHSISACLVSGKWRNKGCVIKVSASSIHFWQFNLGRLLKVWLVCRAAVMYDYCILLLQCGTEMQNEVWDLSAPKGGNWEMPCAVLALR